jgi:hypothetical protein
MQKMSWDDLINLREKSIVEKLTEVMKYFFLVLIIGEESIQIFRGKYKSTLFYQV